MKTIQTIFLCLFIAFAAQAQTDQAPDKVQYQSLRLGVDFNTNYQGPAGGTATRIYIGYHIDQAHTWGVSPFVNGGVYFLTNLAGDNYSSHNTVSVGIEPGLLSGYQNNHIGIKLLTSVHLVLNQFDPENPILTIPVLGIHVGTGLNPHGKKLVGGGYAGIAPFQGGNPGFVLGFELGYRLRPITYVRVAP
jgi:hypothetical protein